MTDEQTQDQVIQENPEEALEELSDQDVQAEKPAEDQPQLFKNQLLPFIGHSGEQIETHPDRHGAGLAASRNMRIREDFLAGCTIEEIQAIVENGWSPLNWIIKIEKKHKHRSTLLDWLEDRQRWQMFGETFGRPFMDKVNTFNFAIDDLNALAAMPRKKQDIIMDLIKYQDENADPERMQDYFHLLVSN